MEINVKNTKLISTQGALAFQILTNGVIWECDQEAYMIHKEYGKIALNEASTQTCKAITTGFAQGLLMHLEGYANSAITIDLSITIEEVTEFVYMSLSVGQEDPMISELHWPAPFTFHEAREDWYTLLPVQQGLLIPNTWQNDVTQLPFHGQFCTAGAYMPWFAQVKEDHAYLAIAMQPWDAGYQIEHPANGPYTHVSMRWLSSLGKMQHTRTVRFSFLQQADYNTICKCYRSYVKEIGIFTSLQEKTVRNPKVQELIGSMFIHKGIKTYVSDDSTFFDPDNPDKNNSLTTFAQRQQEVENYASLGVKKLYFHLDGWAQPGYDNQHPDYFPVCEEAGGVSGLRELHATIQKHHYLLGLHDQYRDFYHRSNSYHDDLAQHDADGNIPSHAHWAGGKQSYLCSQLAPSFVKRNFEYLFAEGIYPEASYLDVFTCNEPDECHHPMHRITRKESLEYRERCFAYLESKGILASSEEANEWAIRHLVFAHYGPYESMMHAPDAKRLGIDVPLFNLVYHECMVLPWPMDQVVNADDQMLFALLNGGAPYLEKDGAYPNTDGVFDDSYHSFTLEEKVARSTVVAHLHEQIATSEMLSHEFLSDDYKKQRTTFADGTRIEIDLHTQTYHILKP